AEGERARASRSTVLLKLSDALTDFAFPLAGLADELDPPLLRQLLVAAAGVWNAQLDAPPYGALPPPTDADVAALAGRLGVTDRRVQAALEGLPTRKRSRFRADQRAFTYVETFWGVGEIRVRVLGTGSPD